MVETRNLKPVIQVQQWLGWQRYSLEYSVKYHVKWETQIWYSLFCARQRERGESKK